MTGQARQPIPPEWTSSEPASQYGSPDAAHRNAHVSFDTESQQHHHHHHNSSSGYARHEGGENGGGEEQDLRRRRSSMSMRVSALRHAGGVNSLDRFARSWQRAAGFAEVVPVRQSFVLAAEEDVDELRSSSAARQSIKDLSGTHRSLLRAALAAHGAGSDSAVEEDDGPTLPRIQRDDSHDMLRREQQSLLPGRSESIFSIEPSLASAFGGSYGSTWGSLADNVNESSMRHAGRLFRQQQAQGASDIDKEREPLMVTQVQDDEGNVINVVIGQSTLPQTVFNSVNVLIGVGLLALPLALRQAGWIPGLLFFVFAGVSTRYTAKLLAKCADVDGSLITFADLAYVSFGPWARLGTSLLFSVELIAACVALVVLFADSLDALIPGLGLTSWKIICGLILLPLGFVPLRFLSFTSVLGILSCFGITLAIIIDGLIKPHQPGSLREPAQTYLFPSNWMKLPVAIGILMSPWGGHSVFPNIYRDMRHPYRYDKAVDITYGFTFALDLLMAVVGVLMFGDDVKDEITRSILDTAGFPDSISFLIVVCVAIVPLTKVPLNARPIVSTLEVLLGLDPRSLAVATSATGMSALTRGVLKITVRVLCIVIFVVLAILVPQFDTIMSLLGAVACFTICIVLPCAFHLKLFSTTLSPWQKALDWGLIVFSTLLALTSTAFNFIPIDD